MKFSTTAKPFAEAMSNAQKIVERRNTYPILANVMIVALADRISLRVTDLDMELTLELKADVEIQGATTVPAHMLFDILRKLDKASPVSFEMPPNSPVLVKSGRSRFNIQVIHPDSFPTLKSQNSICMFNIPGKILASVLGRVEFAISNEETRYYLNGVYMHARDDGITFVATDGHRMARYHHVIDGISNMPGIIVPKKTVGELKRIGEAAGDDEVSIAVSLTQITINHGTTQLTSKLIEGTFPDYERVTPKNNNNIAIIDVAGFTTAADRVSVLSTERGGKAVKLLFNENQLTLSVTNQDHGDATEEMVCGFDADLLEIGFNVSYLLEALSKVGKGDVRIALGNASDPALMTSEAMDGLKIILMPMRV